jgi:hypothetical protein
MQVSYSGDPKTLSFTLIGQQDETLSVARQVVPPGTENEGLTHLLIEFPTMEAGIYGIRVIGAQYPIHYAIEIDTESRDARLIIPAIVTILGRVCTLSAYQLRPLPTSTH